MPPNLFHFATSELSQDAVLCWLLSWADSKHETNFPRLHALGKDFLNLIYRRAQIKTPDDCLNIEIRKQDGGIDVLCIVNHEMAILIEDKVGTKQHSNQLARYKDYVLKKLGFTGDKVIPVYIQTGDQSDFKDVGKHGYFVVQRLDLLNILESEIGIAAKAESDILRDFSDYLRQIEDEVQSFLTLAPVDWSWNSWIGFYTLLKRQLQDGHWEYVANPAGGFLGFWWHFNDNDECKVYLQLEEEKCCFKISVKDAEKRCDLRQHWYKQIISKCADHGLNAKRPNRFGNGECMTVAILDQDYRVLDGSGRIDMPKTLELLQSAQSVIDTCMRRD